jgi:hypothetical protein
MPSPARTAARASWLHWSRGNLFLVPLDDRRQWYRYHQLFADVLQAHLLDEQPDDVPELYRRASIWYEQNGGRPEAIDHALAAKDFDRAADLIELAMPALRRDRREATLRSWLKVIPDELVRVRPVLNIGFVGALVAGGELTGIEDRLQAPSGGWTEAELAVRDRRPPPARWSCATKRNCRAFRAPSRCIAPRWLWCG